MCFFDTCANTCRQSFNFGVFFIVVSQLLTIFAPLLSLCQRHSDQYTGRKKILITNQINNKYEKDLFLSSSCISTHHVWL